MCGVPGLVWQENEVWEKRDEVQRRQKDARDYLMKQVRGGGREGAAPAWDMMHVYMRVSDEECVGSRRRCGGGCQVMEGRELQLSLKKVAMEEDSKLNEAQVGQRRHAQRTGLLV